MIVIESLDRLARDVIIQSVLIKRCIDAGVLLFAANTGENVCDAFLSDPTRKALLQIQGVFNQLEKERLVIKLRKAREAKRQKAGRCEGRKRYGEHQAHAERESAVVNLVKPAPTQAHRWRAAELGSHRRRVERARRAGPGLTTTHSGQMASHSGKENFIVTELINNVFAEFTFQSRCCVFSCWGSRDVV